MLMSRSYDSSCDYYEYSMGRSVHQEQYSKCVQREESTRAGGQWNGCRRRLGLFHLLSLLGPLFPFIVNTAARAILQNRSAHVTLLLKSPSWLPSTPTAEAKHYLSDLTSQHSPLTPHSTPATGPHSGLFAHPLTGKPALASGPVHFPALLSGTIFPLLHIGLPPSFSSISTQTSSSPWLAYLKFYSSLAPLLSNFLLLPIVLLRTYR